LQTEDYEIVESPPTTGTTDRTPTAADRDAFISDKEVIVIPNLSSLDKLPQESIDNYQLFGAVNRECTLHESESMQIKSTSNNCHYYYIENNRKMKTEILYFLERSKHFQLSTSIYTHAICIRRT